MSPTDAGVTVLLNATPVRSDDRVVESVVVTLQDMAEVEELERLRAEFLAMVSHELRGPLTSIKGSAATVLDSPSEFDPVVVRQYFRIIGDQADHMNALVSDLLDVARIETGELAVSPEPAEVAVLVDRARTAFPSLGGGNSLSIDIAPDLPLVAADRRRIVQVLGNLLSNAVRHSPESSVITVTAERQGVHVRRLGGGRGAGHPGGEPAAPVPQVLPGRSPRSRRATRASASPSARGSWRLTAAASGRRATGRDWGRASPSPCPRWKRPAAALQAGSRPFLGGPPRHAGGGTPGNGCASSPWTTTQTTSATSADALVQAGYAPLMCRRRAGGAQPDGGRGAGPWRCST